MIKIHLVASFFLLFFIQDESHTQNTVVEKRAVPLDSVKDRIQCEFFQTDFLQADCNYHSLVSASDGHLYFTLGTHDPDYAAWMYRFHPEKEEIRLVGRIDEALGEDATQDVSQGKVHTRFFEHDRKLWFATHTSFYEEGLPGVHYHGKTPHSGGHFMNYDLESGRFKDLANVAPNEGIISMTIDKEREILYGLTWPSGILVSYDINDEDLRIWGAVQDRGEWGARPWEWDRICRTLAIDPDGNVYGSTMGGEIWVCEPDKLKRVRYLDGLDLSRTPFSQSAVETQKGDFQNNWRVMEWNPITKSFWGILFETTTLFEFIPSQQYVRSFVDLRPQAYQGMPRNPETSQLGFVVGPENTIFYLAHGPAVEIEGRPTVQSSVYLLTYEIDKEQSVNHGVLLSDSLRRPFFAESLAIGPDDRLYTVAWVEVVDPSRRAFLQSARASAGPTETQQMVYEMLLTRLPKWTEFVGE